MRTNLFKSLLVATMAIGAWGGVNAQDYVTTKDNATDPTKQDVTYTFNDGKKYNSKGVLVDANKVAIQRQVHHQVKVIGGGEILMACKCV